MAKAYIGQRAQYDNQEWIVWEVDATGAPSKLLARDEHGFPIIITVENAAKVILIVYSVWEPLKKMIRDIIDFFRKKKN